MLKICDGYNAVLEEVGVVSFFSFRRLHNLLKTEKKQLVDNAQKAVRTRRKRKVVLASLFLLPVLLLGAILYPFSNQTFSAAQNHYLTQKILASNISASGLIQSPVYNLMFQTPSGGNFVVSEIDVVLGQYVHKGQLLARQNPNVLQTTVNAAEANVAAAVHRLEVTLYREKNAFKEARALVNEAVVTFKAAEATLRATYAQERARIIEAQVTLASDQRVLEATRRQANVEIQAAQAQLTQSLATCQSSATSGTTTSTSPSSTSPTPVPLPTSTSTSSTPVPSSGSPTISVTPSPLPTSSTSGLTTPSQNGPGTALSPVNPLSRLNTSPDKKDASQKQSKDTKSSSASSSDSTGATSLQLCQRVAITQYQQAVATANTEVVTAQAQVAKDQAALNRTIAEARLDIVNAQGAVAIARAHIQVAIYDPDHFIAQEEVAQAQEDLTIARGQLRIAQVNLADTLLIAPHDGVVTAINATIGSLPGVRVNLAPGATSPADTNVAIQLVDPSSVDQLLLDVDETDITKVRIGQPVQFTLKAYGNRSFSAIITAISPNGVSIDNKIKYQVTAQINTGSFNGVHPLPNMTADATIITS